MRPIEEITITDTLYPAQLKKLKLPPKRLYFKGSVQAFTSAPLRNVAIVGSRRCTPYADLVIKKLLPELISNNINIISGFMFGVDAKAHSFCVENCGVTVGVLPYGINFNPPNYMHTLYNAIISSGGALVSEYPDDQPPEKWTFIARNRIVAGLSNGVVVVEAGESSGSLHTATFAKALGAKVFSVPGSVFNPNSIGTHRLLSDGAILVASSSDILLNIGLLPLQELPRGERVLGVLKELSSQERNILKMIQDNFGSSFDLLISYSDIDTFELNSVVAKLLLKGLVIDQNGRFYVAKN